MISDVDVLIKGLEKKGLLVVSRKQLLALMIEVNTANKVDARVKWLSQKQAIAKYDITRYWLEQCEKNSYSKLRVIYGKGKTSKKKYNEQSIIDELERQAL